LLISYTDVETSARLQSRVFSAVILLISYTDVETSARAILMSISYKCATAQNINTRSIRCENSHCSERCRV